MTGYGCKNMSFLRDDKIHSRWFPRIKLETGEWAYIVDQSTKTGMVECDTRAEALRKAREMKKQYDEVHN